jgi:hypothetical protein
MSDQTVITVFERLVQECQCYHITASNLEEDIDIQDLRLIKTNFVENFKSLPIDSIDDSSDSEYFSSRGSRGSRGSGSSSKDDDYTCVNEKFQIEFIKKYRYIYTFSIIYLFGTPGCCATYRVTYTKKEKKL